MEDDSDLNLFLLNSANEQFVNELNNEVNNFSFDSDNISTAQLENFDSSIIRTVYIENNEQANYLLQQLEADVLEYNNIGSSLNDSKYEFGDLGASTSFADSELNTTLELQLKNEQDTLVECLEEELSKENGTNLINSQKSFVQFMEEQLPDSQVQLDGQRFEISNETRSDIPISIKKVPPVMPTVLKQVPDLPVAAPADKQLGFQQVPDDIPIVLNQVPAGTPLGIKQDPADIPLVLNQVSAGIPLGIKPAPTDIPISLNQASTGTPLGIKQVPADIHIAIQQVPADIPAAIKQLTGGKVTAQLINEQLNSLPFTDAMPQMPVAEQMTNTHIINGEEAFIQLLPDVLAVTEISNEQTRYIQLIDGQEELAQLLAGDSSAFTLLENGQPAIIQLADLQELISSGQVIFSQVLNGEETVSNFSMPTEQVLNQQIEVIQLDDDEIEFDGELETAFNQQIIRKGKNRIPYIRREKKKSTVENISGTFTCCMCNATFQGSRSYYGHLSTHHGEREWPCDACNEKFPTEASLLRHEKQIHLNIRPYMCQDCGQQYTTQSQLNYHYKRVHLEEKNFSCHICDKRFFKSSDLKCHIKVHNEEKNNICYICGKLFSHPSNLTRHVLTHSGIKPYVCITCGQRYSQLSALNSHLNNKHNGVIKKCSFCTKSFKTLNHLNVHLKLMHPEAKYINAAKARQFHCKVCGKSFKILNLLKEHFNEHRKETEFNCRSCNKTFKTCMDVSEHKCTTKVEEEPEEEIKEDFEKQIILYFKTSAQDKLTPIIVKYNDINILDASTADDVDQILINDSDTVPVTIQPCETATSTFVDNILHSDANNEASASDIVKDLESILEKQQNLDKQHEFPAVDAFLQNAKKELEMNDLMGVPTNCFFSQDVDRFLQQTVRELNDEDWNTDNITSNGLINDDENKSFVDVLNPVEPKHKTEEEEVNNEFINVLNAVENSVNMELRDEEENKDGMMNVLNSVEQSALSDSEFDVDALLLQDAGPPDMNSIPELFFLEPNTPKPDIENQMNKIENENQMNKIEIENQMNKTENGNEMTKIENQVNEITTNEKKTVPDPDLSKKFKCKFCKKRFKKKENFEQHLGTHDDSKKNYSCTICEKKCAYKSTLNRHIISHHTIASLECTFTDSCTRLFKNQSDLTIHIQRDHLQLRRFSCNLCGKAFFKKHDLLVHERVHTQTKLFLCSFCPKVFSHVSHVHKHEKIHSGERPYQCEQCPRRFTQSSTLNAHKKRHLKEAKKPVKEKKFELKLKIHKP